MVCVFDECFMFSMEAPGVPASVSSTHVDDLNNGAEQSWLDWAYGEFLEEFKSVTRQTLPYTHCGMSLSKLANNAGYKADQDEFCQRLEPHPLSPWRRKQEDSPLTPGEVTGLRSVLGGLLWLCQSQLDLIADIVITEGLV